MEILTQMIQLLVGGLTEMAKGIGSGLNALVLDLFIHTVGTGETATQELSTFGVITIVFAGVGLAIGLSRWVVNFITSLGSRNR